MTLSLSPCHTAALSHSFPRSLIPCHAALARLLARRWMYADLSLQRATAIDPSDVLIVAPQFFTSRDYGAYDASMGGSPTSSQLIWDDEEWAEGVDAVNPPDARVGAFDALDATLDYLLNRERFPELVTVVVAGFSLGAQLVHRYSILRPLKPEQDARVNYWIAAPNSFLYLNSTRPLSVRDCPEWNAYKHGLEGLVPGYVARTNQSRAVDLTQERLAARVLARKTSYAVGLEDHAAGSGDCASRAQGRTHLTKMTYWIEDALPFIPGSTQTTAALPAHHRVDWIEGVDHADYRVIQSDAGVRALFLEDFSERGRDAKAPKSNGLKSGKRRAGGDEDGEGNAARRSHPRASSCVAVVAALLSTGVVAVMA